MNVLMLLYLKYPDIRVEKEVQTLTRHGFKVFVLASNDGTEKELETQGNLVIIRPKEWSQSQLWKIARYFWNGLDFLDSWLCAHAKKMIEQYDIDAVHVHDLRLTKTGLAAAAQRKLPVIVDLHENYPAAIKEYTKDNSLKSVLRRITVDAYHRWYAYEKEMLTRADRIITVTEEAKETIAERCSLPPTKVTVVSNTEDIGSFTSIPIDADILRKYEGFKVISYIGNFGRHRGIDTAIKAMPLLKNSHPDLKLVIAGGHDPCEPELHKLAKDLNVNDRVEFCGWISRQAVPSYMKASKIGLIPHAMTEHTETTVPHKLFQYMTIGVPVAVSDCRPLARVVEDGRCGLVFKAGDEGSLAAGLDSVLADADSLKQWGDNATNIVHEKYNWEKDGQKLVDLYNELAGRAVGGER